MTSNLTVGDWVVFNEEDNHIVGFAGTCVRLRSAEGRPQIVLLSELLTSDGFRRCATPPPDELQDEQGDRAALLDGMPAHERDRVQNLERHLMAVIEATNGGAQDQTSRLGLDARLAHAGAQLGISKRQMWREYTAYTTYGLWGIVDKRTIRVRDPLAGLDRRVTHAILQQHAIEPDDSTGTVNRFIRRVKARLAHDYPNEVIPLPPERVLCRKINLLLGGKHTFGAATTRRTTANQPVDMHGRFHAVRPGQVVMLDTTRLDVLAFDPHTGMTLSLELTIAIDLATRTILAWRITPVGANTVDVAMLLPDMMTPLAMRPGWKDRLRYEYLGVFARRLMALDERLHAAAALPVIRPETIVVDNGKVYVFDAVKAACLKYGITLQYARLRKPTDKPQVERAFLTIRQQFSEHVAGYKGRSVADRGPNVDKTARWTLDQIEEFFAEYLVAVYQRRAHDGLRLAGAPEVPLSPNDAYAAAVAIAGCVPCPVNANEYLELLPLQWRRIHPYGVNYDNLVYSAPAVRKYRNVKSPYPGHDGQWPFHVDCRNRLHLYFKDPEDGTWHVVPWTAADDRLAPFTDRTVKYVLTELSGRGKEHPDQQEVAAALLELQQRTDAPEAATAKDLRQLTRDRARTQQVLRDQAAAKAHSVPPDPLNAEPEIDFNDPDISLFDLDDVTAFDTYSSTPSTEHTVDIPFDETA